MLIFYNNFLGQPIDTVVDRLQNKCYLLIQKCATSSLINLTRTCPERFCRQSLRKDNFPFDTVEVFLRDPMERFISGLKTQIIIYGLNQSILDSMINDDQIINFFDAHTVPQFWFLLKFGVNSKVKFQLHKLADADKILPEIKKSSANNHRMTFDISPKAMENINFYLTEDIVLYENFLYSKVLIDNVIQRIKCEIDFVKDIRQYQKEVNYLF